MPSFEVTVIYKLTIDVGDNFGTLFSDMINETFKTIEHNDVIPHVFYSNVDDMGKATHEPKEVELVEYRLDEYRKNLSRK